MTCWKMAESISMCNSVWDHFVCHDCGQDFFFSSLPLVCFATGLVDWAVNSRSGLFVYNWHQNVVIAIPWFTFGAFSSRCLESAANTLKSILSGKNIRECFILNIRDIIIFTVSESSLPCIVANTIFKTFHGVHMC